MSSSFVVKISGNPSKISLILNAVDVVNANALYPLTCLDGYHFEDTTVTIAISDRSVMSLTSVVPSNVRGSL